MKRMFPQLAKNLEVTSLAAFIDDDTRVFEQKLDGHRIFFSSNDGKPAAATTRNGTPYTKKMPDALRRFVFPEGDWLLDGELVGEELWCFDVLHAGSIDLTSESLLVRRAALESVLASLNGPFRLVPQARTRDEKIALAHRALRDGFEGLVLKRIGAPYRSAGRTDDWLKLKFVSTVDVIVTDVRADGKDSVGYAVHDNGTLRQIGRASLIGKEKKGVISVGDVIEVRYLYVGADGRLYQPTIVGKRDDKQPHECTGDQLRFVNKNVLATL